MRFLDENTWAWGNGEDRFREFMNSHDVSINLKSETRHLEVIYLDTTVFLKRDQKAK